MGEGSEFRGARNTTLVKWLLSEPPKQLSSATLRVQAIIAGQDHVNRAADPVLCIGEHEVVTTGVCQETLQLNVDLSQHRSTKLPGLRFLHLTIAPGYHVEFPFI